MADMNHTSRQENPQGKAPSEKHLEDWITQNFSSFGYEETFAPIDEPEETYFVPFCDRLIRRQIRLPNGIPDLIATTIKVAGVLPTSLCVIELKRDSVDYTTMGQCLRYMRDLWGVHYSTFYGAHRPERENRLYPPSQRDYVNEYPYCSYEPVTGIIVGHRFDDPNIPLICAQCNISVVTYEYHRDTESYTFELHPVKTKGRLSDYNELAYGALGDAFAEIVEAYHQHRSQRKGGAE